jgi:hypothetical protein
MSIWSKLFPATPANPAQPTEAEQTPEAILAKALQKSEDDRVAAQKAANQLIEQQLRAWGEDDVHILDPEPPFQDPLGHLTFEQQKAYLADPPPEYIQALLKRAAKRERYEETLFLADPWTFWRFCYDTRPDFTQETLPQWHPWSKVHRDHAITKLRQYDQRFQREVQLAYEEYDSEKWRSRTRKSLIKSHALSARRAAKKQKRDKKSNGEKEKDLNEKSMSEPPLAVIERQLYRKAIIARNMSLNAIWRKHLDEVQRFEDLTEDGETVSEVAFREQQERRRLKRVDEQGFEEWAGKPMEEKVKSVDWKQIHSEL